MRAHQADILLALCFVTGIGSLAGWTGAFVASVAVFLFFVLLTVREMCK